MTIAKTIRGIDTPFSEIETARLSHFTTHRKTRSTMCALKEEIAYLDHYQLPVDNYPVEHKFALFDEHEKLL